MKSWISFLLPNDEYKQKKMLYFFSEGAILLFLSLLVTLVSNRFMNFDTQTVLFLHVVLFGVYVLGRYIVSGIEFADVVTKKEYQKELRALFMKSAGFMMIFMIFYPLLGDSPSDVTEWLSILGLSTLAGVMMFFINFISLKRSYNKNKDLI